VTPYLSRADRRAESEPAESRVAVLEFVTYTPARIETKCDACGRPKRKHTEEGWEIHQEILRARARHAEAAPFG
jgi:hypothetical protein